MNENYSVYKFDNLNINNAFLSKPYDIKISSAMRDKSINYIKTLFNTEKIAMVNQVHSNKVICINEDNYMLSPEADGMITDIPGIALGIKVADCQAVYLYDPVNKVIGNIHSGWKGTKKCILYNAVNLMKDKYNCNFNNIQVYFCPSICQKCFEVDKDVYLMFKDEFNNIDMYTIYKKDVNKYYIDTIALNKDLLISYGLLENNIYINNCCTKCNYNIFHSYRTEKNSSGRNGAFIML